MHREIRTILIAVLVVTWMHGILPTQAGFLGHSVQGDGPVIVDQRNVEAFTGIRVNGSMDVTVTQGEQQTVAVHGEENLIPLIETIVRDDTLVIGSRNGIVSSQEIRVIITIPRLNAVQVDGSGEIEATGVWTGEEFVAVVNGSGDITVKMCDVDRITCRVSGSGDATLSGSTRELTCHLNGSGDIDASEMAAVQANAELHGSGDIRIRASATLNAKVVGSGDIHCTGDAEITRSIVGSGSIITN
ncbi:DUF2807 domain-containing protein [bacterium]|nr:DUF2807 domain-containing protein [candidate division CSSED10-310 bacterium]